MTPSLPDPLANPFGSERYARVWDGWQGRQLHVLESGGGRIHYVSRRWGPSRTLDALPFGVPALVSDADPRDRSCVEAFFRLASLRSTLSLFVRPKGLYPGVHWREQMRSVVPLAAGWEDRVDGDVKRRAARAGRDGWEARELQPEVWPEVGVAIQETDTRHGADQRFDVAFFQKLRSLMEGSGQLYLSAALREGRLGALNVVLAAGGYEVSWCLFATDAARTDGVVPMLWWSWLLEAAARKATMADLGASPSASVQRFKASFGAYLAPYYAGTRRWSLLGSR